MDGENNGENPNLKKDDLGVKTPIFGKLSTCLFFGGEIVALQDP